MPLGLPQLNGKIVHSQTWEPLHNVYHVWTNKKRRGQMQQGTTFAMRIRQYTQGKLTL
jgi:hypothetical protein